MFPRIVKAKRKTGTYEYLVISESIRKKNKDSTTKNIANLGNVKKLSTSNIESLIDGLIKLFQIEKYNLTNELNILESLEHGSIIFWQQLWNVFNLSDLIHKTSKKYNPQIEMPVEKYIEMMVINRCVSPLSKLGCTRWVNTTIFKVLKDYHGISLHSEHFYRAMDYLLAIKEPLEKALFLKLRNLFSVNIRLTFYDITSTYFYTSNCPLSSKGYSRDAQPDKEQIVIGVVTTWEGYPIKHYVFEGNTKDETTVQEVVTNLKKEYNIEETIFVGDRGMITRLNVSCVKTEGYDYIMGVKHKQDEITKELFIEDTILEKDYHEYNSLKIQEKSQSVKTFLISKSKRILIEKDITFTEKDFIGCKEFILNLTNAIKQISYKDFKPHIENIVSDKKICHKIFSLLKKYLGRYEDTVRLIICLNKERQATTLNKRNLKIKSFFQELSQLISLTDKKRKTGKKTEDELKGYFEKKYRTLFSGYNERYKKYFILEKENDIGVVINCKRNESAISLEERSDGIFIITTNRLDLSAEKILDSYKNLKEVELLFDDLKNFVDIRPVRHWLVSRVRAHVFICILSLLLKRAFEINYLKSKSVLENFEEIAKSKFIKYKVKLSEKEERYKVIPKITNMTEKQKKIFNLIGIKNPQSLENYMW